MAPQGTGSLLRVERREPVSFAVTCRHCAEPYCVYACITGGADSRELIECGDLVLDLARCEVALNGRLVALTFKEYELLRFLASHPGRVYTRDALLSKVWGYDYFGGDRTVDVHIRRLRSKIEDASHTFIETVRNIGYRFRCHR